MAVIDISRRGLGIVITTTTTTIPPPNVSPMWQCAMGRKVRFEVEATKLVIDHEREVLCKL